MKHFLKIATSESLSTRKLRERIIFASVLTGGFIFSFLVDPEKNGFFTCMFHERTGYSCLTCGLSRSFHEISHLHFGQAFKFHPMGAILYFGLLLVLGKLSLEIISGKEIKIHLSSHVLRIVFISLMSIFICFGVIRFLIEL